MATDARRARTGRVLLWLAAARALVSLAAIPLAAALWEDHFAVLVLLRPTKEVLLAGGFALRRHDVALLVLAAAAVPLLVLGVWHFFALGRLYGDELDALPRWARRVLPPKRVETLCTALTKRGAPLVVLGRLAAFPSSLLAAAAGASDMPVRKFLLADAAGAALSFVIVVGAGFALGEAYEHAGPWLTGVGVVALAALAVLFGRRLRKT
jgi:membrane-associated protein